MFTRARNTKALMLVALLLAMCVPAQAEMIYQSAARAISGAGTQLDETIESSAGFGAFTEDMLITGYVRDDSNSIVGSVSATSSQTSAALPLPPLR